MLSHHGQVAEMLTDLAASLRGLQRQPFTAGLLASLAGPEAAIMGAIAGRGEQTCLVKFLPLTHLYVPVRQERCIKLDLHGFFYCSESGTFSNLKKKKKTSI